MDPTLQSGDVVAIVPLGAAGPSRGDVVEIDWQAWTGDPGPNAPERIIGLAGDRVELRAGAVIVNGAPLAEPYLQAGDSTVPMPDGVDAWIVPDGAVFVLGDGRRNSADSRHYGFVPLTALGGRIVARCAPSDRLGPIS